jgi:hypothetical protein
MRDYTQPMSYGDQENLEPLVDGEFTSVLMIHPMGVSTAPVYPSNDPYGDDNGLATVTRNHKAGRLFKAGRP